MTAFSEQTYHSHFSRMYSGHQIAYLSHVTRNA
jgi:hypothetical protein